MAESPSRKRTRHVYVDDDGREGSYSDYGAEEDDFYTEAHRLFMLFCQEAGLDPELFNNDRFRDYVNHLNPAAYSVNETWATKPAGPENKIVENSELEEEVVQEEVVEREIIDLVTPESSPIR